MNLHFWIFQHALWIVHFVLVFIFLAHLLRQRKAPTSILAWFLFVLIAPYVGLPLYLAFGIRKFLPAKALIFEDGAPLLSTLVDAVQKTLVASGSPLPCYNSEIQLLASGENAFRAISEMIESSRQSIYVETYIFSSDEIGHQVLKLLTAKAQEGIDVRILIDSVGAHLPGHPSFKDFKRAGGLVAFFMPLLHRPFRGAFNLRNHRKQMIIDGEIALVGGMNLAEEYMGPTPDPSRWTDIAVKVKGQIVGQFEKVFFADWNYASAKQGQRSKGKTFTNESDHLSQLIVSGPDVATDPIYEVLLTAIYGARDRIWLATPYFVPDEALAKAIELACRRGVDVRLVLPRKSNHFLADLGRNTYVQQIQRSGGRIYLFPQMLHAKVTLVDDHYAVLGSANLDGRSLFLNYELGLCLYSTNDISITKTWFDGVLNNSVEGFPKVNWLKELSGDLARLIGPLI